MAISFDGSSYCESAANFPLPVQFETVTFWLKLDSVVGTQNLFGVEAKWLCRMVGDQFENKLYKAGGAAFLSTQTFVTDRWYHIACQGDKITGDASIVIDGLEDSSVTIHKANATENLFRVGEFEGQLDDLRVYDRSLGMSEIDTIIGARGRDGIVDGLQSRWLFNDAAPGVASGAGLVRDRSGATHLTPTLSPLFIPSELTFRRRAA